jgi:hypothetical protein
MVKQGPFRLRNSTQNEDVSWGKPLSFRLCKLNSGQITYFGLSLVRIACKFTAFM